MYSYYKWWIVLLQLYKKFYKYYILYTIFDIGSRYDSEYINFEGEVHYFEPAEDSLLKLKSLPTKKTCSYYNNFGLSDKNEIAWYYPLYQSFYNRTASCKKDDKDNKIELHLKKAKDYINEKI